MLKKTLSYTARYIGSILLFLLICLIIMSISFVFAALEEEFALHYSPLAGMHKFFTSSIALTAAFFLGRISNGKLFPLFQDKSEQKQKAPSAEDAASPG